MATDYFTMMRDVVGSYGEGVGIARDRKYQDEKRARETADYNDRQKELEYQRTQRQGVDDAFANVQGLQTNGVYAGGNTSGMSDGSAEMLFKKGGQPLVDETASYANVENRRFGLAPAQTTSTPNAPTVQSRKATGLDMNRAMLGVATAKKDIGAMQSLQTQGVELEWDDNFGKKLKEYTGSEEQIGATAQFVNDSSKRITLGDAGKDGVVRMAVVKPDGKADFLKLTKQDQAQLYAAGSMMEANPTKALTIMAGINKNLAAAVAADNGIEFKLAEVADKSAGRVETSLHNRETAAHQRGMLGVAQSNAQTNREYKDGMLKLNGEKAAAKPGGGRPQVDVKEKEGGGWVAFSRSTGEPVYNVGVDGTKMPMGMSAERLGQMQKESAESKMPIREAFDANGALVFAFEGPDGKLYSDVTSAKGGLAAPKADTKLPPPIVSPGMKLPARAAAPTEPTSRPERVQGEPSQAYRTRLLQWDENRMRYENQAGQTSRDAERLRLLAGRPDLANMGQGLR